MMPGPASLAAFAAFLISASVDTSERCSTVEPARVTTMGVLGSSPAATNRAANSSARSAPLSDTIVVRLSRSPGSGSSTPVSANTLVTRFVVNGTPANAAVASVAAAGTKSNRTSALCRASPSSAHAPSRVGSPAISRTTDEPARAAATTFLTRAARVIGRPLASTAATISALGASFSARSNTSASLTTTSAAASTSAPRTVINCGSPGPAATNHTAPVTTAVPLSLVTSSTPTTDRYRPPRAAGTRVRAPTPPLR